MSEREQIETRMMATCPMSERLDAIKARAEAATPAPWVNEDVFPGYEPQSVIAPTDSEVIGRHFITADARFIAHAREDIPYLLEQLQGAEADAALLAQTMRHAEWSVIESDDDDFTYCSRCGGRFEEHEPGCWYRAALTAHDERVKP